MLLNRNDLFLFFFVYDKMFLVIIYMYELIDKIDILKKTIDKLEIFKALENSEQEIYSNVELLEKIKKYNLSRDNDLRLDIYSYREIQEYKRLENEINILILHINNRLKEVSNEGSCYSESN